MVGGVHQGETGLEGRGVVDAGGAVAAYVGSVWVGDAVGVPT